MRGMIFGAVLLALGIAACGGKEIAAQPPTDAGVCVAAGGQCVLGGNPCTALGPTDACGSENNPGGAFCCLDPQ